MNTLGNVTKTKITYEEDKAIAVSYLATAILKKGRLVKMNNDGTVSAIAGPTDQVFGVVTVGNKVADTKVTVLTQFSTILKGTADGAIDEGDLVSVTGYDVALENDKYKKSVATNCVAGIALTQGADTTQVTIGVLRVNCIM